MQNALIPKQIEFMEGDTCQLVGRPTQSGTVIFASNVDSLSLSVFKRPTATGSDPDYEQSPIDPTSCMFDELQFGTWATEVGDTLGASFRLLIPADEFAFQGGNSYLIQVIFSMGSGTLTRQWLARVGEVL